MSVSEPPVRPGVILQPPFAILPDPVAMFARRAERLRFLAGSSRLAPYLGFLAEVCDRQSGLAGALPAPPPVAEAEAARAREARMPPIDRGALAAAPELADTLAAMLAAVDAIAMPDAARAVLDALVAADAATRHGLLARILADDVAPEDAGAALYLAAGVQVHAARLAARLDAKRLVPVEVGVCPCCGGRPASSIVLGDKRAEGARYAACATCGSLWNEVRVKCLACGSTKGIGYRSLGEAAVIKAEVCDECHSWVKILYGNKDPALEPIADDAASLGLDLVMRETEWRRMGFNPFLVGA